MPVLTMSDSSSGYPANPRLILKSSYRHWESEPMRWSDSDQIGHANNLAFGAYCETGRSLFTRNVIQHDYRSSRQFVVSQLIVNFIEELYWPAEVMVGTGVRIDEVGFNAMRTTTGWPVEMPPAMPPAWLARNSGPSFPGRIASALSSPRNRATPKPSPISTPLTALMLMHAAANWLSSLA